MKKLYIIKIGGNVINDKELLASFLKQFSLLDGFKILVHGGGKLATNLAQKLGVEQTLIEGRRITNAETLDIAVMVYAGLINKMIVAQLQALQINALGLSGADANLIQTSKRVHAQIDFGFVGDLAESGVNFTQLEMFLNQGIIPVLCAITHDGNGNLLNTNADTLASKVAIVLNKIFEVNLVYCFEKNGVLSNVNMENSYIETITPKIYANLKSQGTITLGMIPKLDNAFEAINSGVKKVIICHAKNINTINNSVNGTILIA